VIHCHDALVVYAGLLEGTVTLTSKRIYLIFLSPSANVALYVAVLRGKATISQTENR
jgi:hypothetical protein